MFFYRRFHDWETGSGAPRARDRAVPRDGAPRAREGAGGAGPVHHPHGDRRARFPHARADTRRRNQIARDGRGVLHPCARPARAAAGDRRFLPRALRRRSAAGAHRGHDGRFGRAHAGLRGAGRSGRRGPDRRSRLSVQPAFRADHGWRAAPGRGGRRHRLPADARSARAQLERARERRAASLRPPTRPAR